MSGCSDFRRAAMTHKRQKAHAAQAWPSAGRALRRAIQSRLSVTPLRHRSFRTSSAMTRSGAASCMPTAQGAAARARARASRDARLRLEQPRYPTHRSRPGRMLCRRRRVARPRGISRRRLLTSPRGLRCPFPPADSTKSSLAYMYWRETGDLSVWRGIAQDAIIMNVDDLLCVGAVDHPVRRRFALSPAVPQSRGGTRTA